MKINKKFTLGIFLILAIILIGTFTSAVYQRSSPQYVYPGSSFSPSSGGYSAMFDREMCGEVGQDFIVQIAPEGCQPYAVRTDLLEEQEYPVYCPLVLTKLNPLIKVEAIKAMQITGQYPAEVADVGFFPSRSALGNRQEEINSPLLDNIGYATVLLKRQPKESDLKNCEKDPIFGGEVCWVEGNLTARIRYDITNAFGVGAAEFYLQDLTDREWDKRSSQYGFWQGRAYVRADLIGNEEATIEIYSRDNRKLHSVRLDEGETSGELYIPELGYCLASFKIKLNGLEDPGTRAKLKINEDYIEIGESGLLQNSGKFLDGKCKILDIKPEGLIQSVRIECDEDEKENEFELIISPEISLMVGSDKQIVNTSVGEIIYGNASTEKRVFVGYLGQDSEGNKFIIPVVSPARNSEEFKQTFIYNQLPKMVKGMNFDSGNIIGDFIVNGLSTGFGTLTAAWDYIGKGNGPLGLIYEEGSDTTSKLVSEIEMADLEKDVGIIALGEYAMKKLFLEGLKFLVSQYNDVFLNNLKFMGLGTPENKELLIEGTDGEEKTELLREYYQKALDDYNVIADDFSNSSYPLEDNLTLSEKSVVSIIVLLNDLDQKADLVPICEKFKEKYSSTNIGNELIDPALEICNNEYKLSSSKSSSRDVLINGKIRRISFEGIYEPGFKEYGAVVSINGQDRQIQKGIRYPLPGSETDFFEVEKITEEYVELKYDVKKSSLQTAGSFFTTNYKTIKLNEQEIIKGDDTTYLVNVNKINLEKFARVSILPDIDYSETEADFKFKIGIEKRSIQLSPEKTKERIEQMDNLVENLNSISDGLGKSVEGLKTACLATNTVLTAKNAWENSKGKGIARQTVMRGDKGWYQTCVNLANNGEYYSEESCLLDKSEIIEDQVNNLTEIIQERDENLRELQGQANIKKVLFSSVVNETAFMQSYTSEVRIQLENLSQKGITSIPNPNYKIATDEKEISISDMQLLLSFEAWRANKVEFEELKEIDLYSRVLDNTQEGALANLSNARLYRALKNIEINSGEFVEKSNWASSLNVNPSNILFIEIDEKAKILPYSGIRNNGYLPGWPDDIPIQHLTTEKGSKLTLVLEEFDFSNKLSIRKVSKADHYTPYAWEATIIIYDSDPDPDTDAEPPRLLVNKSQYPPELENIYFMKYDSLTYQNPYSNVKVRYFESGPYARNPALVPFDLEKGWYVAMKSTLPALGNIRSYDESGRVHSYYLCNVGEDNLEEFFSGIGDDICKLFIPGEPNYPDDYFPGLSSNTVGNLVERAIKAVKEAQDQYGNQIIRIEGVEIESGPPAADIPEIKCQDFMSAKECNILFNVCDPVVCPSSRCDLGGRYPVENVIQSGIVGSVALCLPNWNEKIYAPVCLSGVKTGLDSLISVGEGYQECLQTHLDSGETVGLCDEVHSVYMCEFLWRQATPLLQLTGTKLTEKSHYGGGEYLNFLNLYDTAQQSANFFTQYYAEDSYRAFKARTTTDVGSSFCKSFRYLSFPGDMNIIEAIVAPDSPNQFSGHFDETVMNTITNPPTSHYKVFYHIYAGDDQSAYYRVYLKEGSESSFYNDQLGTHIVDSGYIVAGDSIIETKDFIKPSGYQTMCISVNGIEECGFKQVSTSFSTEYIEDYYLAEQSSEQEIKTTKECISGSASAFNLLNPNIEAGIDELISPEIYNQGIIRVCSTSDPGKANSAYNTQEARWKKVGYCDDVQMGCWLDKESVRDIIEATNLEDKVLDELNEDQQKILQNESQVRQDFDDQINKIKNENKNVSIDKVNLISGLFEKVHFNNQKAYLYLLRGEAYGDLSKLLYKAIKPAEERPSELGESVEETPEDFEIFGEDGELLFIASGESIEANLDREFTRKYTTSELKLLELKEQNFIEYCNTASEQPGDAYCGRYVTQAFDFWFGYGRSYLLGVRGDAWGINDFVIELGGEEINPKSDYSNLVEGDVICTKRRFIDNSEFEDEDCTHVGLYLGEFNDKHVVANKRGQTIELATMDRLLQYNGGDDFIIDNLNKILPGDNLDIKEEWKIVHVSRPNSENLHISIQEYVNKNNFDEVNYTVRDEKTVAEVAELFVPSTNDLRERYVVMWLIRENNNLETDSVESGQKLNFFIPSQEESVLFTDEEIQKYLFEDDGGFEDEFEDDDEESYTVEPPVIVEDEDITVDSPPPAPVKKDEGYAAVVRVLKSYGRSTADANSWANAINISLGSNKMEKSVENYLLVLTLMERESSIKVAPDSKLKQACEDATTLKIKTGCYKFSDEIEKALEDDGVVDEREYLEMEDGLMGKLNNWKTLGSVGSMQVHYETALGLLRDDEKEEITEDNIHSILITQQGGVEFGVRYLKSIIDFYGSEQGTLEDNLAFIFSDYNSGIASSRNAAFQFQINEINKKLGNTNVLMDADGKLGPASVKAIEAIVGAGTYDSLKLNQGNKLLSGSGSKALEQKTFYKDIQIKYNSHFNKEPPYALVPRLDYTGTGISNALSVEKYTSGSMCFMMGQCTRAKVCPNKLMISVIENILDKYKEAYGSDCRSLISFRDANPNTYRSLGFS
jgi:hypothetical protein